MTAFSDIPDTEHYAILQTETIHIPGDERSRTHPGHGYPAEDRTVVTYTAFTDRTKWEEAIARLKNKPFSGTFKALFVRPAKITTQTIVNVKVD